MISSLEWPSAMRFAMEEVEARRQQGIDGRAAIERSVKLAEVLEAIGSGVFSPDEPDRYRGLVDMLTHNDYFLVTADFDSYFETQRSVFRRWRDKHAWWQATALNTARMGWFSSDRTISRGNLGRSGEGTRKGLTCGGSGEKTAETSKLPRAHSGGSTTTRCKPCLRRATRIPSPCLGRMKLKMAS
jgi:hypothetical protein